jgi:hypothetical protein
MEQNFIPSIKIPSDFNGGKKYKKGDGVKASTINNLIEQALFFQELALGGGDVTINITASFYEKEVKATDRAWLDLGDGTYKYTIPHDVEVGHSFNRVSNVLVEKEVKGNFEHVACLYNIDPNTLDVSIITNYKIDMRVIIKGTT